jgi:hypothetical protein
MGDKVHGFFGRCDAKNVFGKLVAIVEEALGMKKQKAV